MNVTEGKKMRPIQNAWLGHVSGGYENNNIIYFQHTLFHTHIGY